MATFKARARALDMLGRQQIAGLPTAINELFKNAHDAYADTVVADYFRRTGLFVLRDDGIGMTETDFESRWLALGTESKLGASAGILPPPKDPDKPHRPVLGEKGIGRLSIALIGPQVLILTRAKRANGQGNLVAAFIHWGLFEEPGLDLDDIEIPIRLFPDGTLPNRADIEALIDAVRTNVTTLGPRLSEESRVRIETLLGQFSLDLEALASAIGPPSLNANGHGTHFYILPTDESLAAALDLRPDDTASPLVKGLIGFTNTMTPGHILPAITASFRDHPDNDSYSDLISGLAFFTPDEFREADHHITGTFDSYGQFLGKVSVYGDVSEDYVVPWAQARGQHTECGPFRFTLAYVQGAISQTRLPADRWSFLTRKLDRFGGLYIYKDGIRVLPYGDTDYDWLDIEKNRTKGAGYYYFSYRRLFGVIEIASATNAGLSEKAGREGFRQNRAYRQFRDILKNFFVQVAADFFRETGPYADRYFAQRDELDRMDKARKLREKQAGAKRRAFERSVDAVLNFIESGNPEQDIADMLVSAKREIVAASKIQDKEEASTALLAAEVKARRALEDLRGKYKVAKPRGLGLTKQLRRHWDAYVGEDARLQATLFEPAVRDLAKLASATARDMHIDVDRRRRLERGLQDMIDRVRQNNLSQRGQVRTVLEDTQTRVLELLREGGVAIDHATNDAQSRLARVNMAGLHDEEIEAVYRDIETSVSNAFAREEIMLRELRDQLEQLTWSVDGDSRVLDVVAATEALEEEVLGLREQADADAELVQLGLAAAIINHEYETAITAVRQALRRMRPWADANQRLGSLYQELRTGFDHLDGYLRLLTPLQRSLYRSPVTFTGAAIETYLRALFRGHLQREEATIEATEAFRRRSIRGNPATFYAVFVNLLDNALFWLRPSPAPRVVRLDVKDDSFIVADTGRGIPARDHQAIFEAGFTRKPGGRGLGLFIAREALRKEHYRLVLEPNGPTLGATFRIEKDLGQGNGKDE